MMRVILVLVVLLAVSLAFLVEKVEEPLAFPESHKAFMELAQKAAIHLNESRLVFGGRRARLGDFPYEAFLTYQSRDGQSYICGASLVTTTHVITAAHCAYDLTGGTLLFGAVNLQQQGPNAQTRTITHKIVHTGYVPEQSGVHNDIAILEFSPAVRLNRYVKIVKIPSNDAPILSSGRAIVSGFGTYTFRGEESVTSQQMLYAEVDLVQKATCRQRWGGAIIDSQLCAGSRGKGVGPGDSGGPIQVKHNGQLYQVGLSSFVVADNYKMQYEQNQIPNVFTRASSFCSFISQGTRGGFRCAHVNG
ncbi:hypothetical protein QR680_011092 [Steinernema hermaphroditum]|uniref:Peptidase S1 domain-containing protein n=1 Tax=Steinernema hermaphroditum TaxID=289476 RepID=A0AA39ISU9_9BILA|nr:hypothetical protein QR680_011092 [Steinernema hermaphroditum]